MTFYSVYLPPHGAKKQGDEFLRLVPDKKSPWALLIPVLWLLYHRLWMALLVYLVITAFIIMVFSINPHPAILYLSALPGLYLLLEGQELVRAKLERKGWNFAGVVEAVNHDEAELRYYARRETPRVSSASARPVPRKVSPTNHGLFPE